VKKKMIILFEMKIGYNCIVRFFELILVNTGLLALTYIG